MLINQFPDKERFLSLSEKYNVIPVCCEILADTQTPVSLLRKIYQDKGPIFLFESVEGGERWGRYSFLGASARTQVKVFSEFVEIEENQDLKKIAHNGDPLSVLRDIMSRYNPAQMPELPRFWGGLVGYLSYEMVSFFEDVPNTLPKDKPLANFIVPEILLIFDNIRNTVQFVAITFADKSEKPEDIYDSAREKLQAFMEQTENTSVHETMYEKEHEKGSGCILEPCHDPDKYKELVKKTKKYIYAGDIIQSVISQPFACSPAPDLWSLYRAQRFINPSPYMYFLHLDDMALVGSSPETMVRLENRVASLRPIAGTRPRSKTEQEDRALANELLQDEKERAEHLMLVDLGRNDLGRVAETGSVQVTDLMFVERYSHVMHLVSNICCDLKPEHDAWDLLKATFPAGTLSGAPKVRAMEIIAELEDGPRGPYGGAVGYFSFHGNMDLAITIRTASIENDRGTIGAGAGI
ncbi:anthranilate synthase component I family protein, partial [Desulfobacterales bacterium HSG16]|nr:anthranilate synthase component I family protein [Desulfobacterales bacterium HSG16]